MKWPAPRTIIIATGVGAVLTFAGSSAWLVVEMTTIIADLTGTIADLQATPVCFRMA